MCCCRYSFCCLNSHHLLAAACGDPEIAFANSFRGPLKKCTNRRPFKLAMQHNYSIFHAVHTHTCTYSTYTLACRYIPNTYTRTCAFIHTVLSMPLHVPLRLLDSNSQPPAARAALTAARPSPWHGGRLVTSSWPCGRGVCKPVTVTVEW